MIQQIPTDLIGILFLILAAILLFVFNYLSVRWIESKQLAKKKKTQCFFTALVGLLIFLVGLWIWNAVFGSFNNWLTIEGYSWPNGQFLLVLGPIIVFLLYIVLVHSWIDATWKNSVFISLLSMFLLALFLTFIPFVGDYLNFGIF
ncbi:MAG: hypothetical protein ACTSYF_15205 [Promethearchaeota archaeon]